MAKWNLIVDVAECTNCNMCVLACQDEYVGNTWPGYAAEMPKHGHRWIDIRRKERGQAPMVDVAYLPTLCNHCDDAPCIAAAGNGAVRKRDDGIVVIDPEAAKGQKQLVDACPYGAIWWNEELQLPQHWNFDAHLIDRGWTETRGAQVCAPRAMRAVRADDAEMQRMVEAEGLEVLHPEYGTKPRVYYKNLYRYAKAFIGGSVAARTGGAIDCVADAAVTLSRGAQVVGQAVTDGYGDFKFDRLDEGSGTYRIEIAAPGRDRKEVEAELGVSVSLGVIEL